MGAGKRRIDMVTGIFPAITIALGLILAVPAPARAGSYLALSLGSSIEHQAFDVWNGPGATGRRLLSADSASSDQALTIGFRDAVTLGGQNFDAEIEIFERRVVHMTARGSAGAHPTSIRTTSMLFALWAPLGPAGLWSAQLGAGAGARYSHYRMTGPGIDIRATDRAPYAMIGLRAWHPLSARSRLTAGIRAHTRPPVRPKAPGIFVSPLEHESSGFTLRLGLQFDLGHG